MTCRGLQKSLVLTPDDFRSLPVKDVDMKTRKRRVLVVALLALPALCLLLLAVSWLSNLAAPSGPQTADRLEDLDKARIAEALHLRGNLGDQVWPGWGAASIPAIIYNEAYAFLVGLPDPADGWLTVPRRMQEGGPWERVPDDDFLGQPYYRQPLQAGGATPQSYTVLVGDVWASSFMTRDWMLSSLSRQVRDDFSPLFPHWWFARQAVGGSDGYIAGLLHEAFHAYAGATARDRLVAAETAGRNQEQAYPWEDEALRASWQTELDLLQQALRAESEAESAELARQFVQQRVSRRQAAGLSAPLVEYERWREWAEGLAKYAELAIWRAGATTPTYQPSAAMLDDADFSGYAGFARRWQNELDTLSKRAGDQGDGRFYYTGMAQAFLLDRLAPGWKTRAFDEGVWLDDLLAQAVE